MARPEAHEHPELPGLTFVRSLGTGGYAEVHLYEQVNTRMRVAVKVLFAEQLTQRARQQFEAEARAMAELADHPYIVQVFQADVTADGRPYLVMKYYPQRNLAERAREERLSVPEVLQIGIRITCAVETAHRAGILHRDIKPHNILTSQYGEPGLTDFGIATRGPVDGADESQGLSVPWSAPEVVYAMSPGDRTADVYSLGATLWHLLAGHSPFEIAGGDNTTVALMRRIREAPVPRTGRDDVPASLERLLAQTMAKEPRDRPQTAMQLARALQAIEAEQRWAPTALVVLDEDEEPRRARADGPSGQPQEQDDDATRRRQPKVVAAQAPPVSTPPSALPPSALPSAEAPPIEPAPAAVASNATPGAPAARLRTVPQPGSAGANGTDPGPGRRERQGMMKAPDDPPTVRRPVTVGPSPANDGQAESAAEGAERGSRRRTLVLVAGLVVGVAAVAAVAVMPGGHPAAHLDAGAATSSPPPPTLALVAPSGPVVTGSRVDASSVRFTWTEANPQPGDRFYWKELGGTMQQATSSSVTLPAPAPGQACIIVEVVRGPTYADSPLTCAG
jgi:serine/threonine protein kinase